MTKAYRIEWTKDGRTFGTRTKSVDDANGLAASFKKMGYAVTIRIVEVKD